MKTNIERFGYDLGPLNSDYDAQLIQDLVTLYATYASHQEYRLMAMDFVELLRLIRANPVELFDDARQLTEHNERNPPPRPIVPRPRSDLWLPNGARGLRIRASSRNPLSRMLLTHCPPEHRVWRYITVYKA